MGTIIESGADRPDGARGSSKTALLVALGLLVFLAGFGFSFFRSGSLFDRGTGSGGAGADGSGAGPGSGSESKFETELESEGVLVGFQGMIGLARGADLVLPCTLGQMLEPGDRVVAYPGGAAHVLTTSGVLSVTPAGAEVRGIEGFESDEIARVLAHRVELAERARSIAKSPPVHDRLKIERPYGSVLFTDRPPVLWRDVQDTYPYRVVLRRGDEVLYDRRVQFPNAEGESALLFPDELDSLEHDVVHTVEVTNAEGEADRREFRCRALADLVPYLRPLEELAHPLQSDHAAHVLCALRFGARGWSERAIQSWRMVHAYVGGERLPLEGLVVLLDQAGNAGEMRDWLRRLRATPELPSARFRRSSEAPDSSDSVEAPTVSRGASDEAVR